MCLTVKITKRELILSRLLIKNLAKKYLIQAKEDITVFKYYNKSRYQPDNIVLSPYRNIEYDIDKPLPVLSKENIIRSSTICNTDLQLIFKFGYHSFIKVNDVMKHIRYNTTRVVFQAVIPKGAYYCDGMFMNGEKNNAIVSTHLILQHPIK